MSKRIKILNISPELLVDLLSMDGSKRIKIAGLPADARIENVSDQLHFDRSLISFRVSSESFFEVHEGCVAPELVLERSIIPDASPRRGPEFL